MKSLKTGCIIMLSTSLRGKISFSHGKNQQRAPPGFLALKTVAYVGDVAATAKTDSYFCCSCKTCEVVVVRHEVHCGVYLNCDNDRQPEQT